MAAHATKPRSRGPDPADAGPRGESASTALMGSGTSSGPTAMDAASSPRRGCPAKSSSPRRRAPGDHQESSSAKATNSVSASRAPTVRAWALRFCGSRTTRNRGNAASTASGEPSVEALATTITGASWCPR